MQRTEGLPVQPGWREMVIGEGLAYVDTVTPDGTVVSYWREGVSYQFDEAELDVVVPAAQRLFAMFIEAGNYVIAHDLFGKLGIPDWAVPAIRELWKDPDSSTHPAPAGRYTPMLYGRFDLCPVLDDGGRLIGLKLFEYNADTPTSMPETALTQWNWFLRNGWDQPGNGQFNTLYEGLVEGWKHEVRKLRRITGRTVPVIHFACSSQERSGEDALNCGLMMEAADEAGRQLAAAGEPGFRVKFLYMCEIVRTGPVDDRDRPVGEQYFSDPDHAPIDVIFKLYPWEWMLRDEFGRSAVENMLLPDGTIWLEPLWKMLWSSKGILPVLWEVFKDRPAEAELLLEAYFEGEEPDGFRAGAVRKPLHGREGSNVTILIDGEPVEHGPKGYSGDSGEDGQFILQRYCPLPEFPSQREGAAYRPILGVFTVQEQPVALIIREGTNRITNNLSYAVPHVLTGLTPPDR